jgi:hypothetical protein
VVAGEEENLNLSDEEIRQLIAAIAPALPPIRWGRWLYLEKATLIGDLLSAAVPLRALGEELLRLRAIDVITQITDNISFLPRSTIRAWAASVVIAVEPFIQDHSSAKTKKGMLFDIFLTRAEDAAIHRCIAALNDYVHLKMLDPQAVRPLN